MNSALDEVSETDRNQVYSPTATLLGNRNNRNRKKGNFRRSRSKTRFLI